MRDKLIRFLNSLGIEDVEEYDLALESIAKDPFVQNQINMLLTKETLWDYRLLEQFIKGMSSIHYPTELTFTYKTIPTKEDVYHLFQQWYHHHYLQSFPLIPESKEPYLVFSYEDQLQFDTHKTMFGEFTDLLKFLNYPNVFKHQLKPAMATVNQEKVDALNQSVRAIVEQRIKEEDEKLDIPVGHQARIEQAEINLAVQYEDAIIEGERQQALRRSRKKGNYTIMPISSLKLNDENVEINGRISQFFKKDIDDKTYVRFLLLGDDAGILVSALEDSKISKSFLLSLDDGFFVRVRGALTLDANSKELRLRTHEMVIEEPSFLINDPHEEKRVELHLHTLMSTMDGVSSIDTYCRLAKHMGHQAIAITDHGVVQAFPEAQAAGEKHGIKMIYGAELYMIDTEIKHTMFPSDIELDSADYVIFDLETTGLSSRYDRIVEFGGVRVRKGAIIDRLSLLISPGEVRMQAQAQAVNGITDAMLKDAPTFPQVFPQIKDFIQDAILISHNASFDIGFLQAAFEREGATLTQPVIDTLTLSRFLFPEAFAHKLGAVAKRLFIPYLEDKAHRAIYDAEVLVEIWAEFKQRLQAPPFSLKRHNQFHELFKTEGLARTVRQYHTTVLAKNQEGLKALYELISIGHLDYFNEVPRTPRNEIVRLREHLLIGSACFHGEVFELAKTGSQAALIEAMKMYDFIEIQPLDQYQYLIDTKAFDSLETIKKILNDIIDIATSLGKIIVATGDVHYAEQKDKIIRDIYISAKGLKGVNHPLNPYYRKDLPSFKNPEAHYRSTSEMLEAFAWLGHERSYQYVITNSKKIESMIEPVTPIHKKLRTPSIEGADDALRNICFERAYSQYGHPLPQAIDQRLSVELDGIINSGYGVIYYITSKIIKQANDRGFIVGSRGSVGSSFAATMAGITEVNPLPPHYYCPSCQFNDFNIDKKYRSGFDLPLRLCPVCHQTLMGDGQNIPFATFLGFTADKVPDIDLNFPRDYQAIAHEATKTLLGEHKVYRAGTIETVADKTAFGYVRGYYESIGQDPDKIAHTKIAALAARAQGVRRTSGQHPGGIVVVPKEYSIYDFSPIQRPADNQGTNIITTHFAFEALHDSLLKFDMLGHVDPLALKMNADLVGIKLSDIPLNDEKTIRCFASDDVLNRIEHYLEVSNGAMGLPEFGTQLGMDILNVIKPKTFNDLVVISGLAHGTNVFNGNARTLIQDRVASVDEVIALRDDIMTYLISKGIDDLVAFKIMEDVRKGKKLTAEYEALMRSVNIPEYYIKSCNKIEYLFPKAHAAAYVTMAVRAAYFKVHHPLAYYATYFTLRSKQYDYEIMLKSPKEIAERLSHYKRLKNESRKRLSPKDADLEVTLMNVLEMKERGYKFLPIDLERSLATDFLIDEARQGIIPPFIVMDGVGENAAHSVVEARQLGPFLSSEDVAKRTKLSSTNINQLKKMKVFEALDAFSTVSLFSFDD